MRIIRCSDYAELSRKAADFVAAQITLKPDSTLGLLTGSTPVGMYAELAARSLDFSKVTTFNLDEYYPIRRENPQSYYYFMTENLYSKVNLNPENIFIPNGEAADPDAECARYESVIAAHGPQDLQVLGIGQNGHIGFNEPASALDPLTHVTELTQSTIDANARFFDSADEVPKRALTMGIATIMRAKRILLLASGKEKSAAIRAMQSGMIDLSCPATLLMAHRDVTVIADAAALGE